MAFAWDTKYGRRRVKHEPPTVAEAVTAAEGLTTDLEEQAQIAAALLNVPVETVRAEAERRRPQAPRVVVVQRKRRSLAARSGA